MVNGIAQAFLDNENHFRRYCTFCASLQKAKDLNGKSSTGFRHYKATFILIKRQQFLWLHGVCVEYSYIDHEQKICFP